MKELDPLIMLAVFQEMLGWLFWPLAVFVVLGAVLLVAVIMSERAISARRLVISEIAGVAGGFFGIWIMMTITNSNLADIGGPIDWVLLVVIWLAGAIGATIAAYIALSLLPLARRRFA